MKLRIAGIFTALFGLFLVALGFALTGVSEYISESAFYQQQYDCHGGQLGSGLCAGKGG